MFMALSSFTIRIGDKNFCVLIRTTSLHDPAIEMPTRMCEDRHHEREANETKQEPNTRDAATINPQSAIVSGFNSTALTDVRTATATYIAVEEQGK